jgi:CheY-like chemotaxis protein
MRNSPSSEDTIRILVVDDEEIVCDVIQDVLGSEYEIDVAFDAHDAIRKIEDNLLDLLIIDYHLPGLDGRQLYEWIASNHPSLKRHVVFSTGDIYDETIERFIENTGCPCLKKPFANAHLRQLVSELLRS